MICKEYFPAYTHNKNPDCKNCKYSGYYGDLLGCRNVNVKIVLQRKAMEE